MYSHDSYPSSFYRSSYLRVICLCLFLSVIVSSFTFAQAPGLLELNGRTVKDGKPLSGATITVYRGGTTEMVKIKTGKNGKFELSLPFGVDYKIAFSYPGCVDMHMMVYTGKLPKEKNNIFPLYETEVPFFETTNTAVRISKYKNPFTKVIYDGKKAFMDDEPYLAQFTKDLLIDPEEAAKLLAEKEAKEKAEKDKLLAAEKAKKDAEEKARLDAEYKAAMEARLAAAEKAAELARLKEEAAKEKEPANQTMETEAIRLQREKEKKDMVAKKNKEIKTNYENDLLKMVAENERIAKQKAYSKQKTEARASTVITQIRKEADVKAKSDVLREEQKMKQQKTLENKQLKTNEMRKLVEAAAFAERSVKISNQKTLPDVKGYVRKETPNFSVTVDEGIMKTTRTTTVTQGRKMDTYRKETYFWGSVYCYKNDIEIDEATYNKEISFFSGYQNK